MVTPETMIFSIIGAVFGSTGFWALITYLIQRHAEKDSTEKQMLKGLAHDRICGLGAEYLKRGYITNDEYENLHDYLYVPYEKLGGNGTAAKIMKEIEKIPIRKE